MCGICGYVTTSGAVRPELLEGMLRTLVPRGPDDEGTFVDERAALGHRRLSIIDLQSGRQPLASEDGRVQAVVNGEIYNFRELRGALERRGHRFVTRSDAEVVAHLYEERGEHFVERLEGMFALAVWDRKHRRLLLARDRMGQKPLYWTTLSDGLAFASELKSLLAHPAVERRLDLHSLSRFLLHGYVPAPWSIFQGVHKLDRAECLCFAGGRTRQWRWWQPPDELYTPLPAFDEAAEEFWRRLRDAVERRLMSDVPLGVFLSGGIDSTSLVACMRELLGNDAPIDTFTIGFDDASCDESSPARRVAEHYRTRHHEAVFGSRRMLEVLPEVADRLDEPFADASVLPTYLLSGFAREAVKVALGGDGGDELLAGYPTFAAHRALGLLRRAQPILRWMLRGLPVSHRHMSVDFLLRQLVRGAAAAPPLAHQIWMGATPPAEQPALLDPSVADALADFDLEAELAQRFARCAAPDAVARLADFYAQTYLQEGVLAKVDRASMSHGLEVRNPFLDRHVVEFVSALPGSYKRHGLGGKRLFKRAARGRLPRETIQRTKHGFGIPQSTWLAGPLKEPLCDLLAPQRLKQQGLFNAAAVQTLLNEHFLRRANHGRALWTLLMFQLWHDRWAAVPAVARRTDQPTVGQATIAAYVSA